MGDGSLQSEERHESLYFSDGNVVLLAPRPDKPGWLFRVHKSVLSYHSQIFSDMFGTSDLGSSVGAPSEAEANHLYDRVPLVHVPDNAVYLELVLRAMYFQSDLPWSPRSPDYPILVTPVLDLSRKYRIDRLYEQIQVQIESVWPQTLAEWDKLERDIEDMAKDPDVKRIDDLLPEPGAAIRLARQFEFHNILPPAFYQLSRLSIVDDWEKVRADPRLDPVQSRTRRTARWELLSGEDFQCLLLGKVELADALSKDLEGGRGRHWIHGHAYCLGTAASYQDVREHLLRSPDPLALDISAVECNGKYCITCIERLKPKLLEERKKLWGKLGCLFRLGGTADVQ